MIFSKREKFFSIKNIGFILLFLSFFLIGCGSDSDDKIPQVSSPKCTLSTEGKRSFWVQNQKTYAHECVEADQKKEGTATSADGKTWAFKIFVDSNDINVKNSITDDILNEMQTKLSSILAKNIDTFGPPPDSTNLYESAIIFLFTDIKEDSANCKDCFVAGFFDARHSNPDSGNSNRVNMLILDGVQFFSDSERLPDLYNTLAHEIQHLIHYRYDPQEETWIDEGLSEMAADLNQSTTVRSLFDPGTNETCTDSSKYYNCRVSDSNSLSLPLWAANVNHYYKTALFFKYLCEKTSDYTLSEPNCEQTLKAIITSSYLDANGKEVSYSGIRGIEAALAQDEIQILLKTNIAVSTDFLTLQSNNASLTIPSTDSAGKIIKDSDDSPISLTYSNVMAIFQSWLVAMSEVAYNNARGAGGIDKGDLDAALGSHRYTSFVNSYPYWKIDSKNLFNERVLSYDKDELPSFSAKYTLWNSDIPHGAGSFSSTSRSSDADPYSPFPYIKLLTIASDGAPDFSPSSDLTGFEGMEIVYNINPIYVPDYGLNYTKVLKEDSEDEYEYKSIDIIVSASVRSNNENGNLDGVLISIGNMPFNEITLKNYANGIGYTLSGDQVEELKSLLGKRVKIDGYLTDKISPRYQPVFEVTSYKIIN